MSIAAGPRSSAPGPRLAARFALREMRGGLSGFYIFIACIARGRSSKLKISGCTTGW